MSLSGMSFWEENLAKRAKIEKEILMRAGMPSIDYITSDTHEEVIDGLRRLYREGDIEELMRKNFGLPDEEFKIEYSNESCKYHLGAYVIILYSTFHGGGCDMDGHYLYDRISYSHYMSHLEMRNIYDELLKAGHVNLRYPTLSELRHLDVDINRCFNFEAIVDQFRQHIKVDTTELPSEPGTLRAGRFTERFTYNVKKKLAQFISPVGRHIQYFNYSEKSWEWSDFKNIDQDIANEIAYIKSKIPEIKEFFKLSNESFRRWFSEELNIPSNISDQSMRDDSEGHVLRSGKRY